MSSKTTMIAVECRLQEWAAQIRDCQNRTAGMSVADWCACHGITKANYYYRLRRVRQACLDTVQEAAATQQVVPIQPGFLYQGLKECDAQSGLDISIKGCSIHVTEETSLQLLAAVLEVVQSA